MDENKCRMDENKCRIGEWESFRPGPLGRLTDARFRLRAYHLLHGLAARGRPGREALMGLSTGSTGPPRKGQFEELSREDCLKLLQTKTVGRVGFTTADGPQILPLNYAISSGTVVFRTAAYSVLAANVNNTRVAFEVDEVDDYLRAGWSVLAVGRAEFVDNPDDLVELWSEDVPEPWAAGLRTLFVRITPDLITGRRVHPA
jgi:uncharacterized protein